MQLHRASQLASQLQQRALSDPSDYTIFPCRTYPHLHYWTQLQNLRNPPKRVPLQDYITTLGSIVPLPQDALHIPENLIQSDIIIENQIDTPMPDMNDGVTEQTETLFDTSLEELVK